MPPIRLGVIGAGLIWIRTHKPMLDTMADAFTPVAFCDTSEQRRAAVAREFPNATVSSDYRQLLELDEVQTVLVLTPIALNAPVAKAALQAGKHVIMEKPIARSVAEGRDLIAAARQAGRMLCVAEQNAYRPAGDTLGAVLEAGEIGDLVMWNCVQHMEPDTSSGPLRYESTAWRKQADFPLGTMFDGGIHLLASLSSRFGIPQTVAASGVKLRPEYGEYDQISALFQYEPGFSGTLSHSSFLTPGRSYFHIFGTEGVISVERERLTIERRGVESRSVELAQENPYSGMWRALRQAFGEQREPRYTPERALNDVATLAAIELAIKTGSRVAVDAAAPDSRA